MMQASFLLIDRNRHGTSAIYNSVPAFDRFICCMAGNFFPTARVAVLPFSLTSPSSLLERPIMTQHRADIEIPALP